VQETHLESLVHTLKFLQLLRYSVPVCGNVTPNGSSQGWTFVPKPIGVCIGLSKQGTGPNGCKESISKLFPNKL